MRIGVPREIHAGEQRVATTPDVAAQLMKLGLSVASRQMPALPPAIQMRLRGAGCEIVATAKISGRRRYDSQGSRSRRRRGRAAEREQDADQFLWPAQNPELLKQLTDSGATAMAMDSVPRISRAQKMDALSSMANIAGYRAVVEAAQHFGRFFTGQITAAGKVPPAKVMVIGAGVAGLAAIGAAKSMGAIVRAFDTRPEVKEQVESMDAEFLMLDFEEDEDGSGEGGYAKTMSEEFIEAEMALFAEQAKEVDIIITTALIPGKPAPELITADMVESMKDGSVVVDLAAEQGGNCELTEAEKVVERNGVSIIGYTDLPSRLAAQSSQLYGTNLRHLLTDMSPEKDGESTSILKTKLFVVQRFAKVARQPGRRPRRNCRLRRKTAEPAPAPVVVEEKRSVAGPIIAHGLAGCRLLGLGAVAPESFMAHFTVFVLACFVGYMVIWNVSPALHTPLMSVTNAISSIIVIGALLQISSRRRHHVDRRIHRPDNEHQYRGRLRRHAPHARNVPQVRSDD